MLILHSKTSPKMLSIKKAIKLGINSNDIDIAITPNNSPLNLTRTRILLTLDAQTAINLQLKHVLVLNAPLPLVSLIALFFHDSQLVFESSEFTLQSLALDFQLRGRFCDAELFGVQS